MIGGGQGYDMRCQRVYLYLGGTAFHEHYAKMTAIFNTRSQTANLYRNLCVNPRVQW